jgi:hypothetical protein
MGAILERVSIGRPPKEIQQFFASLTPEMLKFF